MSVAGQRWTLRYAAMRLAGALVAALGGAGSISAGRLDLAAVLVLVGFAVALIAEIAAWMHSPEQAWYDGRALAESAKTLAWRYAVGADPFPMHLPDDEARDLLRLRLLETAAQSAVPIVLRSADTAITQGMQRIRSATFTERRHAYVEGRTRDQQRWYSRQAHTNLIRARLGRGALLVAEIIALILAVLRLTLDWDIDLAGLMGAAIAAGAAWTALRQYGALALAYRMAANELALQGDRLGDVPEPDWPDVVADAEEAISREHTLWVASRLGRSATS